jgi:glycosyltransferase involved in cell wall biosynthesis
MIDGKKVVVVFPAYNAAKTLERTFNELPFDIVDETILVDDASKDNTAALAKRIGINHVIIHDSNKGYGGNQKSCYNKAIEIGADIAIMVHPDYQYTPLLVKSMCSIIANGVFPVVYASRILGKGALKGGMPWYKYVANRILTLIQNILIDQKLSEYHTGYRAFDTSIFNKIDIMKNSNDFVFDNQIGEVTCPTKYFDDASSINLKRSSIYGLGVLLVSVQYRLSKWGFGKFGIFNLKK